MQALPPLSSPRGFQISTSTLLCPSTPVPPLPSLPPPLPPSSLLPAKLEVAHADGTFAGGEAPAEQRSNTRYIAAAAGALALAGMALLATQGGASTTVLSSMDRNDGACALRAKQPPSHRLPLHPRRSEQCGRGCASWACEPRGLKTGDGVCLCVAAGGAANRGPVLCRQCAKGSAEQRHRTASPRQLQPIAARLLLARTHPPLCCHTVVTTLAHLLYNRRRVVSGVSVF